MKAICSMQDGDLHDMHNMDDIEVFSHFFNEFQLVQCLDTFFMIKRTVY